MKKIVTKIAFALFMLIGMQAVSAQSLSQNQDRPEVIAKKTVAELSQTLDLNGDQQRTLFRAYVSRISNYRKEVESKPSTNAGVTEAKRKIDAAFKESVKKALSEEQYKKWLTLQDQ